MKVLNFKMDRSASDWIRLDGMDEIHRKVYLAIFNVAWAKSAYNQALSIEKPKHYGTPEDFTL